MIPWVKEAFKGGDAAVWNDFIAMGMETRANALLEAKKKSLPKRLTGFWLRKIKGQGLTTLPRPAIS